MNRRHFRYLISITFGVFIVAVLYAGGQSAQAQPLVDQSWDGAFYSSFSANGNVPGYAYPLSKKITTFANAIYLPGYPPIYLVSGEPATTTGGYTGNVILVSGDNIPGLAPTDTPTPVGGINLKPFTDFPPTTCRNSTFAAVSGLPFGPVTISWSAVPGATQYVVALGGKGLPPTPSLTKIFDVKTVPAPGVMATLTIPHADALAMLHFAGTFIIIVHPQKGTEQLEGICIITRQIFAVEKPPTPTPVPPTWTPWPADTGRQCTNHQVCTIDPLTGGRTCHNVCS